MTGGRLTGEERWRLWLRLVIRGTLLALFIVCCIWVVPPIFSLLAPFVLALIVAILLNPSVRFLQRKLGWGRGMFTLLVLGVAVALVGGGLFMACYVAVSQLAQLAENWEAILRHGTQVMEQMDAMVEEFWMLVPPVLSDTVDGIYLQLVEWLQEMAPLWVEKVANGAGVAVAKVPSFLLALVIFLLASYFITADYPYLRTRAIGKMDEGVLVFLREVRQTALAAFGGYLRAQLLLSVGVFFILLAGFFISRQPYGLLLSLGLAVLDFIPILGSGTVMVPWAFVALFTGELADGVEIMVIWGLVALFRRVAEPKFVGNQTGLSPILSLVSIYVGMRVAGVLGMILGPIVALVAINLGELGVFRGLAEDGVTAVRDVTAFLKRD